MDQTIFTAPAPAQLVVNQPKTPKTFHGAAFEDAYDWLEHFDRVAVINDWTQERKLRYVYCFLEDAAKTWFENHEATLTSWDEFRRQFLKAFARADRKETAERAIEARVQGPNERVTTYIEDMDRLFRRAEPSMTESKKVRHLMRGVKEEIFAGLIRNPPATLAEFHEEATAMERALQQRARQYNRDVVHPSEVTSVTLGNDISALRELIRAVIKEELQKMQVTASPVGQLSVAEMVRAELRQDVHAPQQYEAPQQRHCVEMSYAEAVRRPPSCSSPSVLHPNERCAHQMEVGFSPRSPPFVAEARPRKSDIWRTPDRRPLCFHCREAGL